MRRYVAVALSLDLAAAVVGSLLAVGVGRRAAVAEAGPVTLAAVLLPAVWILAVHLGRGYDRAELTVGAQEYQHVARAGVWTTAAVAFFSSVTDVPVGREMVVVAIPSAALLAVVGRFAVRKGIHRLRREGRCTKSVLAVGRARAVLDLVEQLRRDPYAGMRVDAACVPDPAGAALLRAAGVPILGDLSVAADVARGTGVDAVAVTSSSETAATYLRRLSWELEGSGAELLVAPGLMEVAGPRMHIRPFVGLPLLHVEEPTFSGARRLVKGLLDKLVAGAVLLLLGPVLLVIAAAVRLDSAGPAIFRQIRVGRNGEPFLMLKFRTMDGRCREPALRAGVAQPERRRTALQDHRRPADHPGRPRAAALLARRAAAAAQRALRRHVDGRSASAAARRGGAVRRLGASPAAGQARPHRPLAGLRPQRPQLGGVRPAGSPLRGELVVRARRHDPLEDGLRGRGSPGCVLMSRPPVPRPDVSREVPLSTPPLSRRAARGLRRAAVIVLVTATALVMLVGSPTPAQAAGPCTAPVTSPVACENTLAGTTAWEVTPDTSIEGFTTDISTNLGGRVDFKIRTDAARYTVDIYRLGWYGGDGGRFVTTLNPSAALPQTQPECLRNAGTGMVDCGNWTVSASWTVPPTRSPACTWPTCVAPTPGRPTRSPSSCATTTGRSDLVFQTSDTTWQAYNNWGGASLYGGNGPGRRRSRAYAVSYNRPLTRTCSRGRGLTVNAEYPMIRLLERNGYDVSYISGDRHRPAGARLLNHRVFLSVGHDEYWSGAPAGQRRGGPGRRGEPGLLQRQRDVVARPVGSRHRRLGRSPPHPGLLQGEPGRAPGPTRAASGPAPGGTPRFTPAGVAPENALIGTSSPSTVRRPSLDAIPVPAELGKTRLWRNSAVATAAGRATSRFGAGTLGYEWDSEFDNG